MGPNIDTGTDDNMSRYRRGFQVIATTLPSRVMRLFAATNSLVTPATLVAVANPLSTPIQQSAIISGAMFRIEAWFTVNTQASTGDTFTINLTLGGQNIAVAGSASPGGGNFTAVYRGTLAIGPSGSYSVFGQFVVNGTVKATETDGSVTISGNPSIGFSSSWNNPSGNYVANRLLLVEQVN
jgi:hypothetical protein